jgi:hypothetical protein
MTANSDLARTPSSTCMRRSWRSSRISAALPRAERKTGKGDRLRELPSSASRQGDRHSSPRRQGRKGDRAKISAGLPDKPKAGNPAAWARASRKSPRREIAILASAVRPAIGRRRQKSRRQSPLRAEQSPGRIVRVLPVRLSSDSAPRHDPTCSIPT